MREAARLAPIDAHIRHDLGLTLLKLGDPEAALAAFDVALAIDPSFAAAHFRRGRALEMLNQPGVMRCYQRAIAGGLETPEVYSRLATLLHAQGRAPDAAPLYRHAAALAPGTLQALLDGAHAALIDGDLDEAERLFRAALARNPAAPEAHAHLGHILSARGRHDEAAAALEQALTQAPHDVGLYFELASTRRIPAGDPLLGRLDGALAVPASAPNRLKLHLARAKAADDRGDYAAVRAELDAADAIRVAGSSFDRAAVAAQTDAIVSRFTPAYLSLAGHRGSASRVPILVVGMPRSGTTLLEQILASHPDVAGAGEVHFWEEQGQAFLDAAPADRGADFGAVAEAYLARLRRASGSAAHIVDKMPYNFRWAPLIHLAFPNARILHMRRHPADTCLSIMASNLGATPSFSPARGDLRVFYGEYLRLAAHARAVLPSDIWLDVDYERLVTEPEQVIRRVLTFCGLPFDAACLAPERNRRAVVTFSHWQARQPIGVASSGRRRHHPGWLSEFEALTGEA